MLQRLLPDSLLALTGGRQQCTSMYCCPSNTLQNYKNTLLAKSHIP